MAAGLWDTVPQEVEEMRMEQKVVKEPPTSVYTYNFGKHRGKTLR